MTVPAQSPSSRPGLTRTCFVQRSAWVPFWRANAYGGEWRATNLNVPAEGRGRASCGTFNVDDRILMRIQTPLWSIAPLSSSSWPWLRRTLALRLGRLRGRPNRGDCAAPCAPQPAHGSEEPRRPRMPICDDICSVAAATMPHLHGTRHLKSIGVRPAHHSNDDWRHFGFCCQLSIGLPPALGLGDFDPRIRWDRGPSRSSRKCILLTNPPATRRKGILTLGAYRRHFVGSVLHNRRFLSVRPY